MPELPTSQVTLPQLAAGLAEAAKMERLRCAREVQHFINTLPFADVHASMTIPQVRLLLQTLQDRLIGTQLPRATAARTQGESR
jgi:hypothetical protein